MLLLNALGVSAQRILQKQQEYLAFLDTVFEGQPIAAFQFLSFIDNIELAERLLMEGIEPVRSSLRAAVRQEQSKMLNKYEEQRCRIMIRQSRLLFGICDPTGTPSKPGLLKPGTCFVRVTLDGTGEPRTLVCVLQRICASWLSDSPLEASFRLELVLTICRSVPKYSSQETRAYILAIFISSEQWMHQSSHTYVMQSYFRPPVSARVPT